MKTNYLIYFLIFLFVPVLAYGQDVTYTFDEGGNGYTADAGATYTNMMPYGTTTTSLIETKTLSGLVATAGGDANTSNVFHGFGVTSTLQTLAVDLSAFAGSNDHQVVWKAYLKTATSTTKGIGVILRGQNATSGYGTGARQGYHFSCYGSGTSGSVKFRVGKLDASTSYTNLKSETTLPISGFTNGPLYLKAKVVGTKLYFYYSTDGTNYISFPGSPYTDATYSTGKVQLAWGIGSGSGTDQYYDDVTISDLAKNVSLSGSKFIYDGTSKSPTISKTGFTSPTETITYIGISGTSYGPSATAPTAVGTYKMLVSEVENEITRTANQVFSILSSTAFDRIYTFESDVVGTAGANATLSTGANVSAGHTVQLFEGATEGGYSVSAKTLAVNTSITNNRAISSLDYFGTTSTDYSVTWKEYNTAATANKHLIVLRADPTTNNSYFSPATNYRPQGQGYGFLVNPTGASSITLQIYKLNTSDAFTSIASVALTPAAVQGVPLWFRASAIGSSSVALKFEYSTDGTTWLTAATATDSSSPVTSGATHIFGVNSNNQNYYFDYFGLVDLTKNVTADDNKFIYTGSALTPTVSYPGFTTPNTTLSYTGTGSTTYGPSATAPSAVGTYSLAVTASESGATRTGTFGFEIVPNTYDNIYTFKTDGVGNTPTGISYAQGATSGTGVVASYSGTDNGSSVTALTFRPTGLGTVGNTGVADLTSFASSSSYSVTWKEYVSGNGYKKGFLLQGQASTNGYANDLKQGYLFVVYNDATNGTKCRIYTVTANTTLTSTDNANGSVANPATGVARWYRATVGYGLQKFEYSDNGTTWVTANSTSDLTYAGLSGSTQAVYGFGAGVGNYYYDYIASKAHTSITATGGNWSGISWSSTPNANSNITISSGELVVDQDQSVGSLVIAPGAKLTIASGKTLTADVVNLQSDATGTATFVNNGTATITRGTVKQYITAGRNWYIGSPVSGALTGAFGAAGTSKLYWYDEANGTTAPWPQITSNTTGLNMMQGYVVNMANDSTITFSGVLNDGTKSITVNRTVGQTKEGFNLVSNPYASYLDWNNVTKTNLQTSFWQRTKNGSNTYVFDTYNATGQMVVDNSGKGTNRHIPPMQAFWVRVINGQATGTLTVNNTERSHKGSAVIGTTETITDPVFKSKSNSSTSPSVLRLQISNGINTDETLLYTNDNALNDLDAYDTEKMFNNSSAIADIYTLVNNDALAINGLNLYPYDTEIPVGYNTSVAGTLSIKATLIDNLEEGTKVILKDNESQTLTDITDGSTFEFTTDAVSNNSSRLALILRSPSITTDAINNISDKLWISVAANNQLVINGVSQTEATIDIFNVAGQKILSKTLKNSSHLGVTLNAGVYMVNLTQNGEKSSQKFILK